MVGLIYFATFPDGIGSEQNGDRPVVMITDKIVCAITSRLKKSLPTHIPIVLEWGKLAPSTILCEQIYTLTEYIIIKSSKPVGKIDFQTEFRLRNALKISLGLNLEGGHYVNN